MPDMSAWLSDIQPPEDSAPDPLDRPDFEAVWPDREQPDLPDGLICAYEPCPCCGAESIPEPPSPGYICPICWWEIDLFCVGEDEPSDENHGLTLSEARLNFRTFGTIDPLRG